MEIPKTALGLVLLLLGLLVLGYCTQVKAQTQALLPNGQQQFIDANGAPYSGGKVWFYVPGTTTPKSTYQDPAGSIPNANPVVLDSAGRATIWGSGLYREILQDQLGNLIWDKQTYGAIASSGGGGSCGTGCAWVPSAGVGTSTTPNSLRANTTPYAGVDLPFYSTAGDGGGGFLALVATGQSTSLDNSCTIFVDAAGDEYQRFLPGNQLKIEQCGGAVGSANAAATTTAFANANTALAGTGGTILFGPGIYYGVCGSAYAFVITGSQPINVYGSTDQVTRLRPSTNCAFGLIKIAGTGQSGNIRDLLFDGSAIGAPYASQAWTAIWCSQCGLSDITHNQVYGGAVGLKLDFAESMQINDFIDQGCATACIYAGNGPLDQTGSQHVSEDHFQNLHLFNLGNSAGNGIVVDSGTAELEFVRVLEGGLGTGMLIKNSASGTGAHRPEAIRVDTSSNFDANTSVGVDVQQAWLVDLNNSDVSGTTSGPNLRCGPTGAASGNPAVDGLTVKGAWIRGSSAGDNVLIQQCANVMISNSVIDGNNCASNTCDGIDVTGDAIGSMMFVGNQIGGYVYANASNVQYKHAIELQSGALTDFTSGGGSLFKGRYIITNNDLNNAATSDFADSSAPLSAYKTAANNQSN